MTPSGQRRATPGAGLPAAVLPAALAALLVGAGAWSIGVPPDRAVVLAVALAAVLIARADGPVTGEARPEPLPPRGRAGWHGAAQAARAWERAETDADFRRHVLLPRLRRLHGRRTARLTAQGTRQEPSGRLADVLAGRRRPTPGDLRDLLADVEAMDPGHPPSRGRS